LTASTPGIATAFPVPSSTKNQHQNPIMLTKATFLSKAQDQLSVGGELFQKIIYHLRPMLAPV